jgi:hypothetical protein
VKAELDHKLLEKNLKKASKAFGDSTAQSTFRWGVQIARDLSGATQAFGRGKKAQQDQVIAIWMDALQVINRVPDGKKATLTNAQMVITWIDQNRTKKGKRTRLLPDSEKKTATESALHEAVKIKSVRAGMAKGAWIGAGMDIAKRQEGMQKISIGKNFLGYAQKYSSLGNSVVKKKIFDCDATLTNTTKQSASSYVLRENQKQKAVKTGLKKTIKWYEKAGTAKLAKLK